jgi:hypothetical protein
MQLEGSVFGVCVIQLKPQLEALLNLPPDALTKEIRLTQDLLSLFIDYQIPSDLLRFEGPAFVDGGASSEERLAAVKGHVAALMAMIAEEKQREVAEAKLKAEAEVERMAAARAEMLRQQAESHSYRRGGGAEAEDSRAESRGFGGMMAESMDMCAMPPPGAMPAPMMARAMAPMTQMQKQMRKQKNAVARSAPSRGPAPAPAPVTPSTPPPAPGLSRCARTLLAPVRCADPPRRIIDSRF